ncbi:hypothetical protein C6P45_001628 [Maudiozyma exigua]|uniref:Temperature shock-inducible protein 1 n=1 Tax=Maudiozyma exigua TaxID=34358 RepID=A0A9P6W0C9_MAUEX|nr:hypothetical protein C6P45_001628 [Kazachstania exigua]
MVSVKSVIAASALAISAVKAVDVTPEQNADLLVIIDDIESHASDYISLETSNSGFQIPAQVLSLYAALATYTDQSFTTLFSELDVTALTATVTNLPWYSTRLLPALERANAQFSSNSSASATASVSANSTESAVASSSAFDNSTVVVSSATSVSTNATASITSNGNLTAQETGVSSRNASSIRPSSSSRSSSERNSTETRSERNGAEYIGSSSGLLFAGLAALLL